MRHLYKSSARFGFLNQRQKKVLESCHSSQFPGVELNSEKTILTLRQDKKEKDCVSMSDSTGKVIDFDTRFIFRRDLNWHTPFF